MKSEKLKMFTVNSTVLQKEKNRDINLLNSN